VCLSLLENGGSIANAGLMTIRQRYIDDASDMENFAEIILAVALCG
jgi:hypothetical protein